MSDKALRTSDTQHDYSNWQSSFPDLFSDDCEYSMKHRKRGRAIIINNENFQTMKQRVGTQVDADRVKYSFTKLGFTVTQKDNLTARKMVAFLQGVASEDHSQCDCIAIVILSHGEEDVIFGTDHAVNVDQLTSYFNSENCPSLAGKPKLFFIQACRGYDFDDGIVVKSDEVDGVGIDSQSLVLEEDFMMAYATVNGYYSWRNRTLGAWFIQALCEVFDRHGNTMDLMTMLTRVNNIVAYQFESSNGAKKQIPCALSKLTKDLYFRPKYM